MRDQKPCPDCAELVLAQARVCRYCGYRFASLPATRALDWIRRPAEAKPLPALLLDWGTELSGGEDVAFFGLSAIDSDAGFLLVTNRRVVFFAQRGSRKLLEWTLEQVRDDELQGRRGRASLILSGEPGRVTLRHFASESARREVADALQAPPRSPESPSLSQHGPQSD
jgi:hypothetical protein